MMRLRHRLAVICRRGVALASVACVLALPAVKARAQTTCDVTVTSGADSGAGTLRAALANAADNTICFNVASITVASALQITRNVTLLGPGASGLTITAGGNAQVFFINLPYYAQATLSGLTITGGNGVRPDGQGNQGGGLFVDAGTYVTLNGVLVNANTAAVGGGIYNTGTLTLVNSIVSGNTASSGPGGGIYNAGGGTLTLTGSTMSSNQSATNNGGGLENFGQATVSGGQFTANVAAVQFGLGGAIDNNTALTISGGTIFTSNVSSSNGGAIDNEGNGLLTISAATFSANKAGTAQAPSNGGAINNDGTLNLSESTVTANTAALQGGGIFSDGTLNLVQDTISANVASSGGSGVEIGLFGEGPPVLTLNNTLIAGNTTDDCANCGTIPAGNLVGGTPLLGPLASNGGAAPTMMPLPGSPAIAGGVLPAADATDERGLSRSKPIVRNTPASVDVGAVETHYAFMNFYAQPANTVQSQTITPPVAVQVVEEDGTNANYPTGVPVTVSLLDASGAPTTAPLNGTLVESPALYAGVYSAQFADLSIGTPGAYQLQATIYPNEPGGQTVAAYNAVSNVFNITAAASVVTLSWQPASVVYGPLPASELNASATINGVAATGSFVYSFTASGAPLTAGQVYPVGTYGVQVVFTPTGSAAQYTLGTSLSVSQATPTLLLAVPPVLLPRTPLSTANVHATAIGVTGAALAGTFSYSQALGSVPAAGPQSVSVNFVPADSADYFPASASASFTVSSPVATTTTLTAMPNPATPGASVTLNARVTPANQTPGAVLGVETFSAGGATIRAPALTLERATTALSAGAAAQLYDTNLNYATFSADFNGDGVADLLIASGGEFQGLLLSQLSPGSGLAAPITLDFGAGCASVVGLAVGDINGDGLPDIVAACNNFDSTSGELAVLVNEGAGNFLLSSTAAPASYPYPAQLVLGDFNGDGKADAVLVDGCGGLATAPCIVLLAGDGTGGFAQAGSVTMSGDSVNDAFPTLLAADFNGDGRLDLAFLHQTANNPYGVVEIWTNNGGAAPTFGAGVAAGTGCAAQCYTYSASITAGSATSSLGSLVAADFNKDGLPDLALVTVASSTPAQNTYSVVLNASSGGTLSFPSAATDTVVAGAYSVTAADFDGDGFADLALYNSSDNTVRLLYGSGQGQFAAATTTPQITLAPPYPVSIGIAVAGARAPVRKRRALFQGALNGSLVYPTLAAGDANGDGVPDLLVGQFTNDPATNGFAVSAQQFVTSATGIAAATATAPVAQSITYDGASAPLSAYWSASTGPTTLQVAAVGTVTTFAVSPSQPVYGQPIAFSAQVINVAGAPVSGGTVTFTIDGGVVGTAPVANGAASLTGVAVGAGQHTTGASYGGEAGEAASSAANQTVVVGKAAPGLSWAPPQPISSTTPLSSVQLDAAATGVTGASLPGSFVYTPAAGTVLSVGSHTLSVVFTPTDAADYSSGSASVPIQVIATNTVTTLAVAPASSTYGQPITLTAHVSNVSGSTPVAGGTVVFSADGAGLASVAVANGTATLGGVKLGAGSHAVTAVYSGTAGEGTSSGSATAVIAKAAPGLGWAAPQPISSTTPLSSVQLDAAATGVTGASLPGSFVYTPAAGTVLSVGSHTLSVVFTPTDTADYSTASATVTIQVTAANTSTAFTVSSAQANYGTPLTLTAQVTNTAGGPPVQSGSVAFSSDIFVLATVPVVNGAASLSGVQLNAGQHVLSAAYSGASGEAASSAPARTVNIEKLTPSLSWPTPAAISATTPLGAAQLDATATGLNQAPLAGGYVYTPAAGSTLSVGTHTLSVAFTPANAANYNTAAAQVQIRVVAETIQIASIAPSTATLGTTPVPIVITAAGLPPTAVIELNGTPLPTTILNTTQLGATIPAADLAAPGTLTFTVYDAASGAISNALAFAVTAPAANAVLSAPTTTISGEQPTLSLTLGAAYPVDLNGVFTLTFTPAGPNGVDDPAVQFATGGRTYNFTIPAGTTAGPQVAVQAGTVEGTLTVTLTLTAAGSNVTPPNLAPAIITVPAAPPTITGVSFTDASGALTVVVTGFSNTREMTQASFTFTGPGVVDVSGPTVVLPATALFGSWYSSAPSAAFGSTFLYTQTFTLSDPTTNLTGVSVTLTNTAGTSASVNSQ